MYIKRLRRMIFITAILLIMIGIYQEGYRDVLNKAIRICYECIGIG